MPLIFHLLDNYCVLGSGKMKLDKMVWSLPLSYGLLGEGEGEENKD